MAYYYLNKDQKAITDYTQAINFNPNDAYAYYYRGLAHHYNRSLVHKLLRINQNALADFCQAATLFQQQGNTEGYNYVMNEIKELGG